jgi:hypothetical protein
MTTEDYEEFQRENAARSYGPVSLRYLIGEPIAAQSVEAQVGEKENA